MNSLPSVSFACSPYSPPVGCATDVDCDAIDAIDEIDVKAQAEAKKLLLEKINAAQRRALPNVDAANKDRADEALCVRIEGNQTAKLREDLLENHHIVWCFACKHVRDGFKEKNYTDRAAKYPSQRLPAEATSALQKLTKDLSEKIDLQIRQFIRACWQAEFFGKLSKPEDTHSREQFWKEFIVASNQFATDCGHLKQVITTEQVKCKSAVEEMISDSIKAHAVSLQKAGIEIDAKLYQSLLFSGEDCLKAFSNIFVSRFPSDRVKGFKRFRMLKIEKYEELKKLYDLFKPSFKPSCSYFEAFCKYPKRKKFEESQLKEFGQIKFAPIPEYDAILREYDTYKMGVRFDTKEDLLNAFSAKVAKRFPAPSLDNFKRQKVNLEGPLEAINKAYEEFYVDEKSNRVKECLKKFSDSIASEPLFKKESVKNFIDRTEKMENSFPDIEVAFEEYIKTQSPPLEVCLDNFCRTQGFGVTLGKMLSFCKLKRDEEPNSKIKSHELNAPYKAFSEMYIKDFKALSNLFTKSYENIWSQFPATKTGLKGAVTQFEETFIRKHMQGVFVLATDLLAEYQKHAFDRFFRLFNVHLDFVNRTQLLYTSTKEKHPGSEKNILQLITANFKEALSSKNDLYRISQGSHLNVSEDMCKRNQREILSKLGMFLNEDSLESDFGFWEYAHTIPSPGLFAWKSEPPAATLPTHRLIQKVRVLKEPFVSANDATISSEFQKAISWYLESTAKPVDGIKHSLSLIAAWSLQSASETERLPKICNKVDQIAEVALARKEAIKKVEYQKSLGNGLEKALTSILQSSGKHEDNLSTIIKMQQEYCDATRDSIFRELKTLMVEATQLSGTGGSSYIINCMKRHMVGSMYYALRYTYVSLGKNLANEWPVEIVLE